MIASSGSYTLDSGLDRAQTIDAISQAWADGQSLRTYRHAPNTGSRKSWAAGDACSRAVNIAYLVKKGEKGMPSVLTAKTWGFYDVLFKVCRTCPATRTPTELTRLRSADCALEQALRIRDAVHLVHHGERAFQDIIPGGIPRSDRR